MKFHHTEWTSTYSIVAHDAETGDLGVAVQTHQMTVGAIVPWLLPGVGALATQSLVNVSFGPVGLKLLQEGYGAAQVIAALTAADENAHRRQLAVVDAQGRAAAYTGSGCISVANHHIGEGYSVQANMMTGTTVVAAMANAYESATGDLAQRMLAALQAAQAEGGDIRGMQSAALKVVSGDASQPEWAATYNLRVDESEQPLDELARLVRLRHAQLVDREGYNALSAGHRDEAFQLWATARDQAPELEELAFWQAVELADTHADIEAAVQILRPVLADHPRRTHWLDLVQRLSVCGLIEREGAGDELIAALLA
ncbi:MAG: DUF1028 domain-containing protein [Anaerolineae bacterium]|nr:DUF1028 domain-containing protein [Anaerolineae bacterium]